MVYKVVVFDFGGVILNFSALNGICKAVGKKYGVDPRQIGAVLKSPEVSEYSEGKSLFRGTISGEELEEHVLPAFLKEKFNIEVKEKIFAFEEWLGPTNVHLNECMLVAIRKLREKGYRTALLTNNFYIDKERKLDRVPIDKSLFEVIVESAVEGEMKPHPRIYQITQERLENVAPEDVVFLDDLEENFEYPRQMGWKTILVNPSKPEDAVQHLEAVLGTTLH